MRCEFFDQTKELCKLVAQTYRVMRFWKKGELSPNFVGPYEILDRIREADYILHVRGYNEYQESVRCKFFNQTKELCKLVA